MKISRIFGDIEEVNTLLWAVIYDEEEKNEFDRLFDLWTDPEYLGEFFTGHSKDLDTAFWRSMSVEDATLKTIDEADDFECMIYDLTHGKTRGTKKSITELFIPFVKQSFDTQHKQKYKAKPDIRAPFLRLYAIKLEDDAYIITGGAIKLTQQMDGHEHLEAEKKKMDRVKQYLKSNGISYLEDLIIE